MLFAGSSFSGDYPFDYPSNWGGTGLWETPTARVMEDGDIRLGYAWSDPFGWYALNMGVFPGLEVGVRVIELYGIEGEYFSDLKSRTVDFKYQLLPESRYFPALAIGAHDAVGATAFPAEYLVFSRQVFPLDLSLGIGHRRLGGDQDLPLLGEDFGLFGGVELALTDRLSLAAEYNPIRYEDDRKRAKRVVLDEADWPVNLGVKAKIFPGVKVGLSFQRGNTLSFMVHLEGALGEPVIPHRPDPPLQTPVYVGPSETLDAGKRTGDISDALYEAGFSDISVDVGPRETSVSFNNDRYLSDRKAVGRVLRILLFHTPPETERLTAVVKRRNFPFLKVSVHPEHFKQYLFDEISESMFAKTMDVEIAPEEDSTQTGGAVHRRNGREAVFNYGIKPEIQTYLLDAEDYAQFRLGVKPYLSANLWKGGYAYARYDLPFYSGIETSTIPPPDAVRSDAAEYLGTDPAFEHLMIDQTVRLGRKTFGRFSGGYLERMYAGIGGEVLTFTEDGKWAFGLEGDWAVKREPDTQFGLEDLETYTAFANVYRLIPQVNLSFNAKMGRFMYGDYGARFELTREYDTGAVVGAWYTFTDSHKFTGYNEDYHDKGVFISLPIRMFLQHDSTRRYSYVIKPWTRDPGALIHHVNTVFGSFKDLAPAAFAADLEKMRQ